MLAARKHAAHERIDGGGILRRGGQRCFLRRCDEPCERCTGGGVVGRDRPGERQACFRFDNAREQRRDLRAADAAIGRKTAGIVHAGEQSAAIHQKDLAAVGGLVRHVGDEIAACVGGGDKQGVRLIVPFGGKSKRKDARHLRARGGQVISAFKAVVEQVFRLEVVNVGLIPALFERRGGNDLLAAGGIDGAQARGNGQHLGERHIVARRERTVPAPGEETVFIGGDDRGGEPVAAFHVGKFARIRAERRERRRLFGGFFLCGSGRLRRAFAAVCKGVDAQNEHERRSEQREAELQWHRRSFSHFLKILRKLRD